ncbi:hypothetical protein R3W88_033962 [Solanum pinnatisectum]|uniref:Glucan endo-1,3-beta-D-glucosidase n=1 Tax=Solanum pinnatisectum TaxID=50273 RepID=A0AAV9JZH9_9SOLN|nr:hypothetical protein R3W88_033962 [Solanum pinnatisectum]
MRIYYPDTNAFNALKGSNIEIILDVPNQDLEAYFINPIIGFLARHNLPLLANIYPYFGHIGNTNDVPLSYALFNQQGANSAGYQNLFDALLDSMYFATEKLGGQNIEIIVSESGWPSEGHPAATLENARTYYTNLINHVKGGAGTPKKPRRTIETYLFAMFDENRKDGKISEQHFGLFYPDKRPKYQLNFN